MVKQDQQDRPTVPTNPNRSYTYLVLRANRMRQATSKTRLRVSPRWPRRRLSSDQHLDKHWPGGAKIKITLGLITPKGKVGGGEANGKTKFGLAGGVLFKANCQGVPITPNRVRDAKSRNITPV